jgi:opacity protein-like surface antigen
VKANGHHPHLGLCDSHAEHDGARLMRWLLCAVALAFAPSAFAADYTPPPPVTIGPATYARWAGFYFGGQIGYSDAQADFSKATEPLVGYSLRDLELEAQSMPSSFQVLRNGGANVTGFGGFVGYNSQWQDLVLGVEANYTHSPFTIVANSTPISLVVPAGGNTDSVNISATGSLSMTDYGSLRARAGWILGDFLPYAFGGFALGHGSYTVGTIVSGQQVPAGSPLPCTPPGSPSGSCVDFSFPNSTGGSGVFFYGFSVGGGLDVAITPNFFLRGEFEYVQFAPISNITASISTVRGGAGFKF